MENNLLAFSSVWLIVGVIAIKSNAQTSVRDLPYNTSVIIPASNNVSKAITVLSSASSYDQIFSNFVAGQGTRLYVASANIQSDLPISMFKSVRVYIAQDNSANEVLIASNTNVSKSAGKSLNLDLNKAVMSDRSAAIGKIDQYSSVEQAIVGRVPGVEMLPSGDLRVRGINNIVDGSPLFIIDGSERTNLKGMNPNDIASVEVLKNFSETALYGVRGANGVFIIKTKTGNPASQKTTGSLDNFARGSTLRVRLEYVLREPIKSESALEINIKLQQH